MSKEITFILEPDSGKLTTELSAISSAVLTDLRADLGASQIVNCGKPLQGGAAKMSASEDPLPTALSPSGSIGFITIPSSMDLVEEA